MRLLEIINIILNAAIGVLVVGYGIWLKQIIDQQLKTKDTTIETLKTMIEGHTSEIARLKADAAPAIVDAYHKVKTFADQMAGSNNELNTRIEEFAKTKPTATLRNRDLWIAEKDGFQAATDLLSDALYPYTSTAGRIEKVTGAEMMRVVENYVEKIKKWSEAHIAKAKDIENMNKEVRPS